MTIRSILSNARYQSFRHSLRNSALVGLALLTAGLSPVAQGSESKSNWPFLHTAEAPHQVRVLNDGLSSFEARLEMMENAKTSIDCMLYLFGVDEAGRITLHTLMRKALDGVHVRLYLDWFNGASKPDIDEEIVTGIHRELARLAGPQGLKGSFEVRYYNRGTIFGSLGRVNHRNHAKILVVDGREVLVGGRNVSNDYFSMEKKGWEYYDRELWVRSVSPVPSQNIALQARAAFDAYWNDRKWTAKAELLPDATAVSERTDKIASMSGERMANEKTVRDQVRAISAKLPLQTYLVKKATFAIDKPGHSKSDRILTPALDQMLRETNRYLLMENYSMPMSDRRLKLMKSIAARNVPVVVLTNGFEAHDSPGVSAFSQPQEAALLNSSPNVWLWAFKGEKLGNELRLADRPITTKFSTHTKTFVSFSDKGAAAAVGSYNFDVRSEKTNNEAMIVIEDPAVVQNIVEDIQFRMESAHPTVVGAKNQLYYSDTGEYQDKYVSDFKKFLRTIGLWKLLRSLY